MGENKVNVRISRMGEPNSALGGILRKDWDSRERRLTVGGNKLLGSCFSLYPYFQLDTKRQEKCSGGYSLISEKAIDRPFVPITLS